MSQPKPKRIQRKRTKGFRMPPGAVYVGRPTRWGNPYKPGARGLSVAECLERYRAEIEALTLSGELNPSALRGKDLACWCKPGEPCHADILLEIANRKTHTNGTEEQHDSAD